MVNTIIGVDVGGAGAAPSGGLVLSLLNVLSGQYDTSVSFLVLEIFHMLVRSFSAFLAFSAFL